MTINQITSLVKALKAVVNDKVLVTSKVVKPKKAHAATGKGLKIRPAIVERKIDNNCQACGVIPIGLGTANLTIKPIETDIKRGINFAPF